MGANRACSLTAWTLCADPSRTVEVFKFATYLFIPLFAMLHFGDPNWCVFVLGRSWGLR